ncbi:hypothetical protein L6452_02983 [Arctium lappa]|uniref:Uncharacterized protein n=1 Tax=Arctium lappa TaxID=4217 RepID=A0ACB9FL24_ARCLA|nr:hypothetical protein L6452_02983 [Arctium lappa]
MGKPKSSTMSPGYGLLLDWERVKVTYGHHHDHHHVLLGHRNPCQNRQLRSPPRPPRPPKPQPKSSTTVTTMASSATETLATEVVSRDRCARTYTNVLPHRRLPIFPKDHASPSRRIGNRKPHLPCLRRLTVASGDWFSSLPPATFSSLSPTMVDFSDRYVRHPAPWSVIVNLQSRDRCARTYTNVLPHRRLPIFPKDHVSPSRRIGNRKPHLPCLRRLTVASGDWFSSLPPATFSSLSPTMVDFSDRYVRHPAPWSVIVNLQSRDRCARTYTNVLPHRRLPIFPKDHVSPSRRIGNRKPHLPCLRRLTVASGDWFSSLPPATFSSLSPTMVDFSGFVTCFFRVYIAFDLLLTPQTK